MTQVHEDIVLRRREAKGSGGADCSLGALYLVLDIVLESSLFQEGKDTIITVTESARFLIIGDTPRQINNNIIKKHNQRP